MNKIFCILKENHYICREKQNFFLKMTQVALHGLFDYIATLNLSDKSLDWLTEMLPTLKKKQKSKAVDPEIEKIPEEYRCDPYKISPSGDPFFADKRNVEYIQKRLDEPTQEEDLVTIHGHEELDKFLEAI